MLELLQLRLNRMLTLGYQIAKYCTLSHSQNNRWDIENGFDPNKQFDANKIRRAVNIRISCNSLLKNSKLKPPVIFAHE